MRTDVLIVGGGCAGAYAAIGLLERGYAGKVLIAGKDPELPYELPPLSKEFLRGEIEFEKMLIKSSAYWREAGVNILLGIEVDEVHANERYVECEGGRKIEYSHLIWAAGGTPRSINCPGGTLSGVYKVRNKKDIVKIRERLNQCRNVAIIGGGYIGLECAASLAGRDLNLTVLEDRDRVLARVTSPVVSDFIESEHRRRGVKIRTHSRVAALEGESAVTGVRLENGDVIPAEIVIIGIGIEANIGPLVRAGALYGAGVRVDEGCRTSLPNVFAAGDCTEHRSQYAGGDYVRLESVQNAMDQAKVIAQNICGGEAVHANMPWFWSDQYHIKLQTIGLSHYADQQIIRGSVADGRFSVIYLRGGAVIGIDCINSPQDYVQCRKLVQNAYAPGGADIGDANIPLRSFARA